MKTKLDRGIICVRGILTPQLTVLYTLHTQQGNNYGNNNITEIKIKTLIPLVLLFISIHFN